MLLLKVTRFSGDPDLQNQGLRHYFQRGGWLIFFFGTSHMGKVWEGDVPPSIHSADAQKKCVPKRPRLPASLNSLDYMDFLEMNTNSLATEIKSYESVNSSALVD